MWESVCHRQGLRGPIDTTHQPTPKQCGGLTSRIPAPQFRSAIGSLQQTSPSCSCTHRCSCGGVGDSRMGVSALHSAACRANLWKLSRHGVPWGSTHGISCSNRSCQRFLRSKYFTAESAESAKSNPTSPNPKQMTVQDLRDRRSDFDSTDLEISAGSLRACPPEADLRSNRNVRRPASI